MISREEAVKHLEDIRGFVFDHKWKESMDMAIEALSHERPKGRWVEGYDFDWLKFIWSCDQCGEDAPTKPESCDQILKPYCPNCGAEMARGEEE